MENKLSPMINELNRIYSELNEYYYEGELPDVFITIYPGKRKTSSIYGSFSPDSWAKADKIEKDSNGEEIIEKSDVRHEISMSAEFFTRPVPNWVATMAHEMVHLYCHINNIVETSNNGRYHNKLFMIEAEKRDLIVEKADVVGWGVTSPDANFVNFVNTLNIDTELFKYFRDTKFGETKPVTVKKYVCPICGLKAQAKKGKLIMCGNCMKTMDYWDLTDPDDPVCLEDLNDGLAFSEDGWLAANN